MYHLQSLNPLLLRFQSFVERVLLLEVGLALLDVPLQLFLQSLNLLSTKCARWLLSGISGKFWGPFIFKHAL